MATAKKAGRPSKAPPQIVLQMPGGQAGAQPGADSEQETGEEKATMQGLFDLLGSIDGGIALIHRVPEHSDRDLTPVYVGKIPFAHFGGSGDGLLDLLRDEYGGGKFYVRLGNGKGQWKGKQFTVRVEKKPATAAPAAAPPAAAVPPAAPKLTDNPHFGKAMELAVTGAFGLLTALVTRGGGGGVTVADLVALQKAQQPPDPLDSLAKLAQVRDFFNDGAAAPAAAGGTGWKDLVASALKAAPALLAQAQGGMAAAAPQALPAPQQHSEAEGQAGPSAPAPGQPPAPAPGAVNEAQAEQRALIGMLVRGAENGSPAQAYAYAVDDTLGKDVIDQLLATPDPVPVILGLFPPLEPHKEWVAELVDALRQLQAEQQVEEQPAGQGGGS